MDCDSEQLSHAIFGKSNGLIPKLFPPTAAAGLGCGRSSWEGAANGPAYAGAIADAHHLKQF